MRILFLGAGGTGGYFGARLIEAGADVTFLVRAARAHQLATHGLRVVTPSVQLTLPARTVLAETVRPDYDIVFLTCKAYDLESSIAALAPAMHAQTCVIPLLNGVTHLDRLDATVGSARVMGGCCQIGVQLTADGIVRALSELHSITWGARCPSQAAVADALGGVFALTPVRWQVSRDILLDMWEKLVFLSTLAGMTALMRANVGEINATTHGKSLLMRYLATSVAIAAAEGYSVRAESRARAEKALLDAQSLSTASMLRDLESGGEVEASAIVGTMLNLAAKHGIEATPLALALTHLQAYQNRRAANRLPLPR